MTTLEWLNRGRVLDDKIYRLQKEYLNVQYELLEVISKLPDRQDRIILIDYYCSGLTWAMIAENLGVTYKNIDRMKNKALQHLEEAMGKSQQKKGADGERELVEVLKGYGFQTERGGSEPFGTVPDITGLKEIP